MKDYGLQRSSVRPLEVEITESLVFIANDIVEVTEVTEEATNENEQGFTGFEFNLIEYTKDEYIQLQADKISTQTDELTSTQLALCDVYELLG